MFGVHTSGAIVDDDDDDDDNLMGDDCFIRQKYSISQHPQTYKATYRKGSPARAMNRNNPQSQLAGRE